MAIACDICEKLATNPDYTLSEPEANREILKTLCNLIETTGGISGTGPTPEVVPISLFTVPFGSVPTPAYAAPATYNNTGTLRSLTIYNALDVDIVVSFNGIVDHMVIPGNGERTLSFKQNGTQLTGDVWVKAPVAPASGNVYFSGY